MQSHAGCSSSHSLSAALALICFFFLSFLRKVWASQKLQTSCCEDKTRADAMQQDGRRGKSNWENWEKGCVCFLACTQHLRVCMCWHELIAKECAGKQRSRKSTSGWLAQSSCTQLNWINITDSWAINSGWTRDKLLLFSTLSSLRWLHLALICKSTTWLPTDWLLFML